MAGLEVDGLPQVSGDLEVAKSNLEMYGYCLLKDALSQDQVAALRKRLVEQAAAERQLGAAYEDGGPNQNWGSFRDESGRVRTDAFTAARGGVNQRLWMLINKGRVFHQVLFQERVREVIGQVLGEEYLLSSFTANIANPGGVEMDLHTDQWWMPSPTRPGRKGLPVGSITRERSDTDVDDAPPMIAPAAAVNVLWMLVDFTAGNGGTRVVPGSHLFGRQPDRTSNMKAVASEGPAGTALIIDARVWHGTGANVTGGQRLALLTTFCGPQFRPQENFTVGTSQEVLREAAPELLALLGFKVWHAYGRIENPAVEFISPREPSLGELRPESSDGIQKPGR